MNLNFLIGVTRHGKQDQALARRIDWHAASSILKHDEPDEQADSRTPLRG